MKQRSNILDRAILGAQLPGECPPGVPLVEIAGENRILVENHYGISQYGGCEICVKMKYGSLRVCGCNLELARMTKVQLVITGRIDSVHLCRRER